MVQRWNSSVIKKNFLRIPKGRFDIFLDKNNCWINKLKIKILFIYRKYFKRFLNRKDIKKLINHILVIKI